MSMMRMAWMNLLDELGFQRLKARKGVGGGEFFLFHCRSFPCLNAVGRESCNEK
jgi:hypothetical protein